MRVVFECAYVSVDGRFGVYICSKARASAFVHVFMCVLACARVYVCLCLCVCSLGGVWMSLYLCAIFWFSSQRSLAHAHICRHTNTVHKKVNCWQISTCCIAPACRYRIVTNLACCQALDTSVARDPTCPHDRQAHAGTKERSKILIRIFTFRQR